MAGKIVELDEGKFDDFIKEGKVIIDFWAPWCGPCKMMGPIFAEACEEISSAKFGKVNVDENQELSQRFSVMSIPTMIFFKDGEQVDRVVGVLSKEDLSRKLESL